MFTSFDKRPGDLFIKRVGGSGAGEVLFADQRRKIASDWSTDGKYVIYHALSSTSQWDIEAYSLADKKIIPLLHGPSSEFSGHLSPDGRWLAYVSDESGSSEIYVQHFPTPTERWQISGGGGTTPAWSRDGRELYYYVPGGKFMAATIHTENGFIADAPRLLFTARMRSFVGLSRNQYGVTSDKRFLINVSSGDPQSVATITLVQNWMAKLPPR